LKKRPYWFLIYGFNILILGGWYALLFLRLLAIGFYTLQVGGVSGAAIMGVLDLFAVQLGCCHDERPRRVD
jgi:hypothetical protein